MDKKENKTKDSQIKASRNYDERKGNVTIACKVTKDYKKEIEQYYKSKGFKSMNEYLLSLIESDMLWLNAKIRIGEKKNGI